MINRWLAGLVAGLAAVSAIGSVAAAGTSAGVPIQQKVAAGYRVVLEIGRAQPMGGMENMNGGMTIGGKPATCRMPGTSAGGATAHAALCNRHVAVQVFDAQTTKVVIKARVTISLRNQRKHASIQVPILMMMSSGGLRSFQYGNNITAGAGAYMVTVTVNRVHLTFATTLP